MAHTDERARGMDPSGSLYQQRAVQALPILVRQAHAGETIYYGDLADEMGMPNARNLNYVLGAVGSSLAELGKVWVQAIPPLQALVVNRADGMPGSGFVHSLVDPQVLAGATSKTRRQVIDGMLADIFTYPRWQAVLEHFGLSEATAGADLWRQAAAHRGSGESQAHKELKKFVADYPAVAGVQGRILEATLEYCLPSGDEVDVLFRTRRGYAAVEVKSAISSEADVARGIFQCVKYRALLDALAASQGAQMDVTSVLVLGGSLTREARKLANTLGIQVFQKVGPGSARQSSAAPLAEDQGSSA